MDATATIISLLSLDVGFDLRATGHTVVLPALPFRCQYARDNGRDDSTVVDHECTTDDDLSELRRDLSAAGYVV